MMKKLFAIAWKDTINRFASKWELLFFLILPIAFTMLLAGGTGPQNGDSRIPLLVVDEASTPLSAEFVAGLEQSDSVRPDLRTRPQAEEAFNDQDAAGLLIIPPGFSSAELQNTSAELELRQQPGNLDAQVIERQVLAVSDRLGSALDIAKQAVIEAERLQPFPSEAARRDYFDRSLAMARTLMNEAPDRLEVIRSNTEEAIEYDPLANSSAGQLITWVFIPLLAISALFAEERTQGTLRRLLTTPTTRATFLVGTISGQVAMALVQMLLLVGFGILVMNVNWGHNPAALAAILIPSALAAAALGVAMGTFIKTEGQASGLSIMLGMLMALLGGCWYPIELFPEFVRTAVKVIPTTWAMQGMLDIVLRGQGLAAVLPEAAVLLGFAAIFLTIGVLRFRYE